MGAETRGNTAAMEVRALLQSRGELDALSSSGLSRGSIHQRVQEFFERWIPATSAGMTVEGGAAVGFK
jgi:hypothetical protein